MADTRVEDAKIEVGNALQTLTPHLNGLRDLAAIKVGPDPADMSPRAHEDVVQSIARHEKRVAALRVVLDATTALLADGHPNMPPTAVDPTSLASILDNAATIAAAAATFVSNDVATRLDMAPGPAENKNQ